MTGVKSPVNAVTLVTLLWAAASAQQPDINLSCGYMSSQVLPCTFKTGDDLLVHWFKLPTQSTVVHSYYNGEDQLKLQLQQFRTRTSLFYEQLSRGNASLLLQKVQVADRGRYRCYTSITRGRQESFVNLEVEAPVTKVSIVLEEGRVTCRSEGIYPRPRVTWSRNQSAKTSIEQTEQQLYNISSSVLGSDDDFTCRVSNMQSSRSATLTTADFTVVSSEETLDCCALKPPLKSVTWRFNNSLIVHREDRLNVSESWRKHLKDLSTSGSLTLQDLSPELSGIYTCEVVNEEETHVKILHVTMTEVQHATQVNTLVIVFVILILIAVVAAVLVCVKIRRRRRRRRGTAVMNAEAVELRYDDMTTKDSSTSGPGGRTDLSGCAETD